ncbi:hypothetical protein LCGC14_0806160 [marine sediment metagenome]|uniref:Uncharacterized protein n=1 Tax=marine sediment metagenome TaxID=412755 RepID=A0A0F9S890_9ZZZZ
MENILQIRRLGASLIMFVNVLIDYEKEFSRAEHEKLNWFINESLIQSTNLPNSEFKNMKKAIRMVNFK